MAFRYPLRRLAWSVVTRWIRRSFPDVRPISVRELSARLAAEASQPLVLADTRSREEFEVSYLPGAIHIGGDLENHKELTEAIERQQPIVVYCSIGYRSAKVARQLAEMGAADVRNLEGSIFLWANSGRHLAGDSGRAESVHPYDRTWGLLLKPKLRAQVST